jgi:hypothetical protein
MRRFMRTFVLLAAILFIRGGAPAAQGPSFKTVQNPGGGTVVWRPLSGTAGVSSYAERNAEAGRS